MLESLRREEALVEEERAVISSQVRLTATPLSVEPPRLKCGTTMPQECNRRA